MSVSDVIPDRSSRQPKPRNLAIWARFTSPGRCPLGHILSVAVLLLNVPGQSSAGELVGSVTAGRRPVREAVLFVEALRSPLLHERAMMDQRRRTFLPHVMAVQVGTRVEFPNHDLVYHNVFST